MVKRANLLNMNYKYHEQEPLAALEMGIFYINLAFKDQQL